MIFETIHDCLIFQVSRTLIFFFRYTDFIVNEILPSGKVLHLQSLTLPRFDSSSVCKTGSLATASTSTSDTIPDYKSRGEAIEPPGLPQHENEPGGNVSSKTVLASSGLETVAGSEFRVTSSLYALSKFFAKLVHH